MYIYMANCTVCKIAAFLAVAAMLGVILSDC